MNKKRDIGEIDRNLKAEQSSLTGMDVYSVDDPPIQLTGLYWRRKG